MSTRYSKTLVLDTSYMPRGIIATERAFAIWYKGNCEIIHAYPEAFKLVKKDTLYYKPCVIKVGSYINLPAHMQKVSLSRDNIYKRDDYTCVYCGETRRNLLNLDHIIPQSKGGKHTWTNLVTACLSCNGEKADLDIEEWGKPYPNARKPHYLMLLKKTKYIPREWKPYLMI